MDGCARVFSRVAVAALLFLACGSDSALQVLDAGSGGALAPADGSAPPAVDAGDDVLSGAGASADGAAAVPDLRNPLCGNGQVDRGEDCDDGNTLSGDGCSSRCQIEGYWPPCPDDPCVAKTVCGNAILTSDETCDDGNIVSGDGCSADCKTVEPGWRCRAPGSRCAPICGDHLVKGSETCDDGNTLDGDGCSFYCLTEPGWDCTSGTCVQVPTLDGGIDSGGAAAPYCGDGIVSGAEECDRGASNDDSEYGGCTTTCSFGPYCGDGVRNGSEEGCDLGAQNGLILGKGGCTIACTTPHYCGDGLVDTDRNEECDLGDRNGAKLDSNMMLTDNPAGIIYCTADCTIPQCCVY